MFPTVRDVIDVVDDVIDDVLDDVIGDVIGDVIEMSLMTSLMMSLMMSSYALVLLNRTIDKVIFFFTTCTSVLVKL